MTNKDKEFKNSKTINLEKLTRQYFQRIDTTLLSEAEIEELKIKILNETKEIRAKRRVSLLSIIMNNIILLFNNFFRSFGTFFQSNKILRPALVSLSICFFFFISFSIFLQKNYKSDKGNNSEYAETKINENDAKEIGKPFEKDSFSEISSDTMKTRKLDEMMFRFHFRAFSEETKKPKIQDSILLMSAINCIETQLNAYQIDFIVQKNNKIITNWLYFKGESTDNFIKSRLLIKLQPDKNNKIQFIEEFTGIKKVEGPIKKLKNNKLYSNIIRDIKSTYYKIIEN
jgi:hypothetical protein